ALPISPRRLAEAGEHRRPLPRVPLQTQQPDAVASSQRAQHVRTAGAGAVVDQQAILSGGAHAVDHRADRPLVVEDWNHHHWTEARGAHAASPSNTTRPLAWGPSAEV